MVDDCLEAAGSSADTMEDMDDLDRDAEPVAHGDRDGDVFADDVGTFESGRRRRSWRRERERGMRAVHRMRRQCFRLGRAAAPAALSFGAARAQDFPMTSGNRRLHLPEAATLPEHVVDECERMGEVLHSVHEARPAELEVDQNNDVRRISAVAALIAIPTMVVGNYGMNFEHMPEPGWAWGCPRVVGGTAALGVVLYTRFRRSGWL
ncbi:CorA family divalent cation transporter [Streptomyces sp. SID3343]|uniref:CorA family divalent cation transporter n=1 Tax=Streptomyces sp. SID3343 TaxID=2690260 RepID=UPI00136CC1A9